MSLLSGRVRHGSGFVKREISGYEVKMRDALVQIPFAVAQQTHGAKTRTVAGTAVDPSNAAIVGAGVLLTELGGKVVSQVTTDGSGGFSIRKGEHWGISSRCQSAAQPPRRMQLNLQFRL